MAMIKCPECGTEISDKAEACPKCAYPISNAQAQEKTQTIQQTSKKLKKQVIFSVLAIIIGMVIWVVGAKSGGAAIIGILLTLAGLIWLFATKIKIWWHHK